MAFMALGRTSKARSATHSFSIQRTEKKSRAKVVDPLSLIKTLFLAGASLKNLNIARNTFSIFHSTDINPVLNAPWTTCKEQEPQ